jgi:hypothetical protein
LILAAASIYPRFRAHLQVDARGRHTFSNPSPCADALYE